MRVKQICAAVALAAGFVLFDAAIYVLFTSRCISSESEAMQEKSIELESYLPFEENSLIVKLESGISPNGAALSGNLPVLDGATALYPIYSAFMNSWYPNDSCDFDGESFADESLLQKRGTGGAYKAVADGTADIIFCAKPSEKQLEYAAEQGAELTLVPIGYEAFVFIVNKDNPIESLTVEQLRGIYSGEYTSWEQVGGEKSHIGALQRTEGSGSQTMMQSFMGETEMKRDILAFTGRSIGYSFRYYVESVVQNGGVKMLSVNGAYPSAENIRSGDYPLVDNFYAIYRSDNENENIPLIIEMILSDEGQKIISETGYISINEI